MLNRTRPMSTCRLLPTCRHLQLIRSTSPPGISRPLFLMDTVTGRPTSATVIDRIAVRPIPVQWPIPVRVLASVLPSVAPPTPATRRTRVPQVHIREDIPAGPRPPVDITWPTAERPVLAVSRFDSSS